MRMLAVLAVVLLSSLASASENDITNPTGMARVEVVEGRTAKLPCAIPLKHNDPQDPVNMIIWYKKGIDSPIYVIKGSTNEVWAEASVGSRALFVSEGVKSPYLQLEEVTRGDSGVYSCRVDYLLSATEKRWSSLSVIVLPGTPTILEEDGTQVEETLGPYDEGANIQFTCQVVGGEPSPQVTWWRGEQLLKGRLERREGEVRNTLSLGPLTRTHLDAFYTCQASNTPLVGPVNKAVKLDVNFKPERVEIEVPYGPLEAGKEQQFVCKSEGGRPPAELTWSLRGQDLSNFTIKIENSGNVSMSILSYVPTMEDSGENLVCRARSPAVDHVPIADTWKLDVKSIYIFPITPILGVLIGVVGALVLVAIVVVVVMKLRGDARRDQDLHLGQDGKQLPPHVPLNTAKDGEDGPDVILCRADSAYEDVDGIPQKLKHVNIYETVPYDKEMGGRQSESSDPGDVEYAELTFSNGKNKQKNNNKKSGTSGANGTIRSTDDNTIYAVIDHARTAQQQQRHLQQQKQQQAGKQAGKQATTTGGNPDSQVLRQPDEIPLMDAALESSV